MSYRIALDGMGGDHAPEIVVDGAALALERHPDLRFILYGDEARLKPLVGAREGLGPAVEVCHAEAVVTADMKPSAALRQRRPSSMRLAIDALKTGDAAAAVSAGNTGALMAVSMVVLRSLPGIDRPAIASCMPSRTRSVVVLDLGANAECTAENLFQFAVMGEVYARAVLGVDKPLVGLLNIGTEEMKGDSVVKKAAALVRDSGLPIQYAGFVEGTAIAEGVVDVVVTDGFTGNVALKVAEGTATLFSRTMKDLFAGSLRGRLGYLIAKPVMRAMRDRFDPRLYNGAMLLGLNGVVVKSHGGTDAIGFAAAIGVAVELLARGTNARIIDEIGSVKQPAVARDPTTAAG